MPAATPVAQPAASPQQMSLVAAGDEFEGKLTTTNGVRVLGTVRGTIESRSNVQVDEDALVEADITAENVSIAGTYKGNLNCTGRLEITASGRASGQLETGRILLHEGGFFEGTLHMKPDQPAPTPPVEGSRRRYGGGT
jgi:cytoskeletal protein CcmA (bactofilin family)